MTEMEWRELNLQLLKACYEGNFIEAEALLKQGADPNFRIPDNERNPLFAGGKGSQSLDSYLQYIHSRNPECDRDAMMNLLAEYGALIPHAHRYSYRFGNFRAAVHHLVRQGMPVDYREYCWAKERGFHEITEALEARGVCSDQPVYDVDAMLAAGPAWRVLHDLFTLCDGYNDEKPPQLNHHERVLCDVYHCAGEACNGLDHALQQNCFQEIFSRKAALEEIDALRAYEIVEELRLYHRSLGAVEDLECGEFYFLYTGNEEECETKCETMIQFARGLSSEFLDEVNRLTEAWFLNNLDHFRVRKAHGTSP